MTKAACRYKKLGIEFTRAEAVARLDKLEAQGKRGRVRDVSKAKGYPAFAIDLGTKGCPTRRQAYEAYDAKYQAARRALIGKRRK